MHPLEVFIEPVSDPKAQVAVVALCMLAALDVTFGGVIGYIGSNGTIYVVNRSTLTFSANQAYRFTATYAV